MRLVTLAIAMVLVCLSGVARAGDDGAWLERAAEQAASAGNYARAVALLRGLQALRSRDPSPTYRLAEVFTLAGQYEDAIAEYRRFSARAEADPARKSRAEAEAKRLEEAPVPFAEAIFKVGSAATAEARKLFDEGKRDAQAKHYDAAIAELQAALLLDPDLPGSYRLLGAVYGKSGDRAAERTFLADYLRIKPDGKIADTVRARLKEDHVLGTVTLDASYPCTLIFNGRETELKTPLRAFSLPAGKYKIGFKNDHYQIIGYQRLEVVPGKNAEKKFAFGVLGIKLDPWARVRVDGKDVGLFDEVGVPEGKHTVHLRAHDGSKEKTVEIHIKAGEREKLSW